MPCRYLALFVCLFITMLSASVSFAGSSIHGYDELDRLKWTQYEDGTVISYDYDKVGNRIEKCTYSSANQLCTITSPSTGAVFMAPASITFTASATSLSGATINKVEYYNGSNLLGSATTGPTYNFTWLNVPIGSYILTAKAYC